MKIRPTMFPCGAAVSTCTRGSHRMAFPQCWTSHFWLSQTEGLILTPRRRRNGPSVRSDLDFVEKLAGIFGDVLVGVRHGLVVHPQHHAFGLLLQRRDQ